METASPSEIFVPTCFNCASGNTGLQSSLWQETIALLGVAVGLLLSADGLPGTVPTALKF
eukprot:755045-Amphidinium_carterae.2